MTARYRAAVALVCVPLCAASVAAAPPAPPSAQTIIEGVRARERAATALSGTLVAQGWHSDLAVARYAGLVGWLRAGITDDRRSIGKLEAVPEDLTLVRFAVDRSCWRFEVLPLVPGALAEWSGGIGNSAAEPTGVPCVLPLPGYEVCDGANIVSYWPSHQLASRLSAPPASDLLRLLYFHLGLALRRSESAEETLAGFRDVSVDGPERLAGQSCYRLTERRTIEGGGTSVGSIWVAPDRGFAVVRHDRVGRFGPPGTPRGSRRSWQGEEFTEVAPGLWLPMVSTHVVYRYAEGPEDPWESTTRVTFQGLSVQPPGAGDPFHLEVPLGTDFGEPEEGRRSWVGDTWVLRDRFEHVKELPLYDPTACVPLPGGEIAPPRLPVGAP